MINSINTEAVNAGEGVFPAEEFEGLLVLALIDQGDAALNTRIGRTGRLARCGTLFFDGICRRHGLGVELVGRLLGAQSLIELIGDRDGANLVALAAGGALIDIDETGRLG